MTPAAPFHHLAAGQQNKKAANKAVNVFSNQQLRKGEEADRVAPRKGPRSQIASKPSKPQYWQQRWLPQLQLQRVIRGQPRVPSVVQGARVSCGVRNQ
jgi:hypothetical protein